MAATTPITWVDLNVRSHSLPTRQLGCFLHLAPTKQTLADIIGHSLMNILDHFFRVYFWLWRKPSFPRKGKQGLWGTGNSKGKEGSNWRMGRRSAEKAVT